METRMILEQLKKGQISVEEAELFFRKKPFEELEDFAKLDTHREIRSGFPEVVYCSGKTDEHLVRIYCHIFEARGEVFGTRASRHQYELIKNYIPSNHLI